MRPFFPRIRGGAGDSSSILADLVEYHARNPGVTEATLGALTTRDGRTGYDLLAERVPAGARSVLDLGCGNGPLLRRLLRLPQVRTPDVHGLGDRRVWTSSNPSQRAKRRVTLGSRHLQPRA